jgi:hypothetical protein
MLLRVIPWCLSHAACSMLRPRQSQHQHCTLGSPLLLAIGRLRQRLSQYKIPVFALKAIQPAAKHFIVIIAEDFAASPLCLAQRFPQPPYLCGEGDSGLFNGCHRGNIERLKPVNN